MRVIISAMGSRGDIEPMIGLAQALRRAGHTVIAIVPERFVAQIVKLGIECHAYRVDVAEEVRRCGTGPLALPKILDWLARGVEEQATVLPPLAVGAGALVSTAAEFAPPSVAEALGIPYLRVCFVPVFASGDDVPVLPWQGLPAWCNRLGWRVVEGLADRAVRPPLDAARARLGLSPIRFLAEHILGSGETLMAFDPDLVPRRPDWPVPGEPLGYCFGEEGPPLPPDLEAFLAAGSTPVFVGFGSMSPDARRLTEIVFEAARISRRRIVLGSGWADLGAGRSSDDVHVIGDVSHARLFPRLAGVVHHGGAGTTHTAARAGVPQVIVPHLGDQYFWGARVAARSLGPSPIPSSRLDAPSLARLIRLLVEHPTYGVAARGLAARMSPRDGAAAVAGRATARSAGAREVAATHELRA